MLYDETAVRANIRNREGKRVFYLRSEDTLTPLARDFLRQERIEILPAKEAKPNRYRLLSGGFSEEKPEHMTHLNGDVLVPKTHPRIRFRGMIDFLEAELLLCGEATREILDLARKLIRCDVLNQPVGEIALYGLTEEEQRKHSHFPQDYYGIPHFMPDYSDGEQVLRLNRCRSICRQAELCAVEAFSDRDGNLTRETLCRR